MSKISEFVQYARTHPAPEHGEIDFGMIPNFQAQLFSQKTGVNVIGVTKVLSLEGIRHSLKRHGDDAEETKRGQKGVTDLDFEYIPDILRDPGEVRKGDKVRGQDSLVFVRKIKGFLYHVVARVDKTKEKNAITVVTMYIKR